MQILFSCAAVQHIHPVLPKAVSRLVSPQFQARVSIAASPRLLLAFVPPLQLAWWLCPFYVATPELMHLAAVNFHLYRMY